MRDSKKGIVEITSLDAETNPIFQDQSLEGAVRQCSFLSLYVDKAIMYSNDNLGAVSIAVLP